MFGKAQSGGRLRWRTAHGSGLHDAQTRGQQADLWRMVGAKRGQSWGTDDNQRAPRKTPLPGLCAKARKDLLLASRQRNRSAHQRSLAAAAAGGAERSTAVAWAASGRRPRSCRENRGATAAASAAASPTTAPADPSKGQGPFVIVFASSSEAWPGTTKRRNTNAKVTPIAKPNSPSGTCRASATRGIPATCAT